MTAVAAPAVQSSRSEAGRHILAVVRLLFVNKTQLIYVPLLGQVGVFLLNYAIWVIIRAADGRTAHLQYSGALGYIYVFALVVAVQVILRTFPFSLGFGVTRRDFYLGAATTFVILSVLFSAVVTVLSVFEIATNGWGVGGRLFAPAYFTSSSWLLRFVLYVCIFLFMFFVGAVVATFYMRWRAFGVIAFFFAFAVVLVGGIALATLTHEWPAVGQWFANNGIVGTVLWTLVPTAIAAIGGFLVLRRATPKS